MDRLVVKGPTRSKLPVDEQCRRGTSGKASFSTYLQTANEGGKPCRPNMSFSLAMPFPEAVQEADPGLRAASGAPDLRADLPARLASFRDRGLKILPKRRVAWVFCGPLLVSSTGDAGCSENVPGMSKCSLSEPRLRMLLAEDSGSVVMKVDIRMGVCNNSPAKASSSENEWRSRVLLTPSSFRYVDSWWRHASEGDYKAETQSCRGIPRGTFFAPLLGGERRRATTLFWQRPRPMPP